MPSIASHFTCAKLVSQNLNIDSIDFYKGNILPDIIDVKDSHHKIKGIYYDIPDVEYFIDILNFQNYLDLGYFCHLLLDKYFLEEYIPNHIKNYQKIDLFSYELIYRDYTIINQMLIEEFNLDLEYLNLVMSYFEVPIDKRKYQNNIKHINEPKSKELLTCLNIKTYIIFLKEVSEKIANELKVLRKTKK